MKARDGTYDRSENRENIAGDRCDLLEVVSGGQEVKGVREAYREVTLSTSNARGLLTATCVPAASHMQSAVNPARQKNETLCLVTSVQVNEGRERTSDERDHPRRQGLCDGEGRQRSERGAEAMQRFEGDGPCSAKNSSGTYAYDIEAQDRSRR